VPERVRWPTEPADRFVSEGKRPGERRTRAMLRVLGPIPASLARAGRSDSVAPLDSKDEEVRAAKESHLWAPSPTQTRPLGLRWFLRGASNADEERPEVWVTRSGAPVHRRWPMTERPGRPGDEPSGRELSLGALEGSSGSRRIHVLRLRTMVLGRTLSDPTKYVPGKGRAAGKWRTVPVR